MTTTPTTTTCPAWCETETTNFDEVEPRNFGPDRIHHGTIEEQTDDAGKLLALVEVEVMTPDDERDARPPSIEEGTVPHINIGMMGGEIDDLTVSDARWLAAAMVKAADALEATR